MLAFYPVGRKDVPAMLEIPPADVSSVTITRNPLIGNSRDVVIDRGGQPMPVTVLMAKHFGATVAATALGDRVQIQD
jgi:hypothetical protein